jgi:two-component system, NtrC family, response regulator HydG
MQLVALNGALAGATYDLSPDLFIQSADDGSVGPQCGCRIRALTDGGFTVEAIDGGTSVFVNGLPLSHRPLRDGDEIRVGESLFIARDDTRTPFSPLLPCRVAAGRLERMRTVMEVGFDDAVLYADHIDEARAAHDLARLARAVGALTTVRGLAGIDGALAGFILSVVPAARVAFIDCDGGGSAQSAWSAADTGELIVDASLVKRACDERVASIVEVEGRHALVGPMMAYGRVAGAAWIEARSDADAPFDASHLRLFLIVTALAAVAREESREAARLQTSKALLQAEINLEHNMVGHSQPMRALFDRIARVAQTEATVLIRGESGTGKELVARAVHRNSPRADRPFVAINCAALTETLLESELFGHEKGAFTGAVALKKGRLELADGGTLFLDEIGELPLVLQAKLLRALQEREFERVGGTRPVRVDIRLITATNRDLDAAVRAGQFRQDLFYRLNVVALSLPALRERKQDLPLLAEYFVRKHAARCGRRPCAIASNVVGLFLKYDWPGNVRELENIIEQALVLGSGDCVVADDLPAGLLSAHTPDPSSSLDYHETLERTKRELILRAFDQAGHNHTQAARLLGVHPNYLHRLLSNLGLRERPGAADSRSHAKA